MYCADLLTNTVVVAFRAMYWAGRLCGNTPPMMGINTKGEI